MRKIKSDNNFFLKFRIIMNIIDLLLVKTILDLIIR